MVSDWVEQVWKDEKCHFTIRELNNGILPNRQVSVLIHPH
jgi:hypothetical protein